MSRSRPPALVLTRCIPFVLLVATLASCGGSRKSATLEPRQGMIDVPGGKVWYQIVGTGKGTPLLLLHGGPGIPGYYLKPLAALGDERPVIFYDQLGAGRSEHPTDSTLWTTARFVQELAAVRTALGLNEVHLYGHSWGSLLAIEYMKTSQTGVKSLIFASPALDLPRWKRDADSLLSTMPDSTVQKIRRNESAGTFDTPEYQSAMMEYYHRYIARKEPWAPELDSTLAGMNPAIYIYMQGPSEFTITGTLKDYDTTPVLGDIRVPTLFIVGEYDEALPSTVAEFAAKVPGAKMAIVPGAAHLGMHDAPEEYIREVREFLKGVEKR